MNNKISIIIPVYNVEKYLHQCIDSVINQTLKDIEIICVNDGSTDNSLNILNEYAKNDTRIRIINKKNSGYGDSMNKGIDVATGEYIGFVESDDFASLNMFEELYNLAKEFDAEVVRSNWYRYKEDSSNKESTNLYIDIPKNCIINPIEYKDLYIVHTLIASAIYSRKYLNEFNIRFLPTPGASYQDTSFEAKTIMTANRIIVTNESFYNYRIDNPNSSVKQTGKVFCICDE